MGARFGQNETLRHRRSGHLTPGRINLARAFGASLVTYEGVQHGVFGQGVACVDEPVLRYLIDLTPPREGLVCRSA
ncbi:alpha/beta hydrolase [Nocardia amikacinitolerans]|uniref:alpha/beta hydrolase n=1 Tax=Nocardia amikacinitolerans TaxID=756689 RepID=UPI0020A27D56|nr:alpha/beta hydrolase [Nocardia amikacinitolerans]MCP2289173.1 TAP-like protein [Nocardia amikacinitolerans]